jgi:hypothetical protein
MQTLVRRVLHRILPQTVQPRKLWLGLAKGATATIDFRWDAAFYFGRHEPDLHRQYRRLLRRGMRCFDVGMYRGWDALGFAQLTGAEVVSFDGDERSLEQTARFLSPSGASITLVHAYLSDGSDGNLTIDRAAAAYFEPDFIKIDVEGSEASVLRGGKQLLTDRKPTLVIETHGMGAEADTIEVLKAAGYDWLIVERSAFLSEARSLEHNRWLICNGKKRFTEAR